MTTKNIHLQAESPTERINHVFLFSWRLLLISKLTSPQNVNKKEATLDLIATVVLIAPGEFLGKKSQD